MSCRAALRHQTALKKEQQRCEVLLKEKKQAVAAKAESEMQHRGQASDIAALRKELIALQAAFTNVRQQQQVAFKPPFCRSDCHKQAHPHAVQ